VTLPAARPNTRAGRLAGKRAVVTGASSGIGRAIALRFAGEGASVAVLGRDNLRTHATAEAIRARGGTALPLTGDLTDGERARELVDQAAGALGGLDVLVNNAGTDVVNFRDVHEWSVADFDHIIDVNMRAPFLVARAAIPHLLDAGGGGMLHLSSICSRTVWAGDFAYGMAKAALNLLSQHIAVEYGSRGIWSNALLPAVIITDLEVTGADGSVALEPAPSGSSARRAARRASNPGWEAAARGRHPVGRCGTVQEVADAAVFLCSGEAPFLTGANIPIDGGYGCV
jgi:NAD(P)-dependent dehydrogenase (short-subunit alcohol dehydrogenase family)